MNIKKRGLHRGLDALLKTDGHLIDKINHVSVSINDTNINTNAILKNGSNNLEINNDKTITILNIKRLNAGQFQPRKDFSHEELSDLVSSIKKQGILQPLIVRELNYNNNQKQDREQSDDNYEIIAGERRFRAAKIAGLTEVPVIIKNVGDRDALTIALVENIQRANLNPLEEALALDRLIKEFSLTHQEIAIAIGKSRTVVTNLLRILQLPYDIKQMLEKGQLELGHAKVLLGATYEKQLKIANNIIKNNLSVRATEELLKKLQIKNKINRSIDNENFISNSINNIKDNSIIDNNTNANLNLKKQTNQLDNEYNRFKKNNFHYMDSGIDPDLSSLERRLSEILGAKIVIETLKNSKNKGKGKLIIEYNSLEELEGILEHFELVI